MHTSVSTVVVVAVMVSAAASIQHDVTKKES